MIMTLLSPEKVPMPVKAKVWFAVTRSMHLYIVLKQVILKQFNSRSFFDQGSFFLDNDILLNFIDQGNDLLILNR